MSKKPRSLNVVQQFRRVWALGPLTAIVGLALGGFVPLAIYVTAHRTGFVWGVSTAPALALGGLVYSAQTVFQWARLAFISIAKSLGFVVLLEGVMVTSPVQWLALLALGYLIVINAVATACTVGRPAS